MYGALRFLPRNLLSFLTGRLAYAPLPRFMLRPLLNWYVRKFNADLSEAERPLEEYSSLGDFFTRNLKEGARPIGDGIVSPVDGALTELGQIERDKLLQAKGKHYSLGRFLRSDDLRRRYEDGFFLTFYLAPGDYHHIHSPVDGTIVRVEHIPGTLWPVNDWSIRNIPELFSVNERVITLIESNYGLVAVVKVGATNVGSIVTPHCELNTNWPAIRRRDNILSLKCNTPVRRGDRIGSFRMGSSVVVLFEPGRFAPGGGCVRGPIRYGTPLLAQQPAQRGENR